MRPGTFFLSFASASFRSVADRSDAIAAKRHSTSPLSVPVFLASFSLFLASFFLSPWCALLPEAITAG